MRTDPVLTCHDRGMDPAARLLRLLSLLQARPTWSAADLAGELDVDRRTVRRDVARLRSLGYPVGSSPGVTGYELGAGGRLPPLLLDDDEAVAIAVALRLAATAAVAGIESSAVAAMAKLDQVLPSHVRERVGSLQASTVHMDRPRDRIDAETLSGLATACRWSERVHFTYRPFVGEPSSRRVEPYRIVHTRGRWYLVGRDLDRGHDGWRTFRVDRIFELERTGHRFVLHDPPDVEAQVARAVRHAPAQLEATIVVDLPIDVANRRLAHDAVVERDAHGRAVLRITGSDARELARRAIALPCAFEVLGPPAVRSAVRELAGDVERTHQ